MTGQATRAVSLSVAQLNQLLHSYAEGSRREPQNLELRCKLAEVLRLLNRTDEAIALYSSVAWAHGQMGDLGQAITYCKVILELSPTHSETQQMLAGLYASQRVRSQKQAVPVLQEADGCWVADPAPAVQRGVDAQRFSRQTLEYLTVRARAAAPRDDDAPLLDSQRISSVLRMQEPPALHQRTAPARSYASIQREIYEAGRLQPESGDGSVAEVGIDEDPMREVLTAAARPTRSTLPPLPREPFPLFSDLDGPAFLAVVEKLQRRVCAAGTSVFEEGDPGDSLFLVSSGALAVLKRDEQGSLIELSRLSPGSFFGEFALLTDRRRHASVRCVEDSELLELRRKVLFELVEQHPSIAWTLRTFYQQRLMAMVLATSPLFRAMSDPEERRAVLSRFTVRRIMGGEIIIEEDRPSSGFFVLLIGEAVVSCRGDDGNEVPLGRLCEGDYFGEISLLTGETAAATVRATTIAEVLTLSARDFYDLASVHPEIWVEVHEEAERRQRANAERLGHTSAAVPVAGLPCLI